MNGEVLLWHEIAQFLYFEAALLDERRFVEWLDLLTEDVHYWMPIRSTRSRGDEAGELTRENEHAYFDEDKKSLSMRVKKWQSAFSWSENPPSRTRHLVSNIRLRPGATETSAVVDCGFVVYRCHQPPCALRKFDVMPNGFLSRLIGRRSSPKIRNASSHPSKPKRPIAR